MSSTPTFSVIIPTFNRAALLPRAIGAVLKQDFADFELIVVDDGSTDGTSELLEKLENSQVQRLYQENRGVSAARNLGLSRARGKFITFLDSDDEAHPDWLATFARHLAVPSVGIVTAGAKVVEVPRDGEPSPETIWLPRPLGPLYSHQHLRYTAGTLAARRDLLTLIGGYAERLRFAENAELAMRLVPACLERGLDVAVVNRPIVTYYRNVSAWSTSKKSFERKRAGAEYILEQYGERFRREAPWMYGNYRSVAAVNAARLGQIATARRHLLAAIRVEPRRWRSYLRFALTLIPPLARRYWTRHGSDGLDQDACP